MSEEKIVFCTGGGCTAKLGAGVLSRILEKPPRGEQDPNQLVGYDSKDDAAVYRITDDLALVQTVDFFPPMVDDPYTFGQIAAANALSDVYAMGGEVKTALNLVCFPEGMDLNVLGEILRGRVGEAAPEEMEAAIRSMTTLNKTAAEIARKYEVHAATDVTGFSFLGHLHEMMGGRLSCVVDARAVPVLPGAWKAADACLDTAAGQRNRNHTGPFVRFENVPFPMEEILFDPQTSGGLLLAAAPQKAEALARELCAAGLPAAIVGEIRDAQPTEITVKY